MDSLSMHALSELLDSGDFSDFAITCQGCEWKVHKSIVCSASKVSASKVVASFIKNPDKESQENVVPNETHDADTMDRMIKYIYNKNGYELLEDLVYELDANPDDEGELVEMVEVDGVNARLIAHARMHGIADYYQIQAHKDLVKANFMAEEGFEIENFIHVVAEVDKNPEAGSSDRGLRNALRDKALPHADELIDDDTFMRSLIELDSAKDFSVDLLHAVVKDRAAVQADFASDIRSTDREIRSLEQEVQDLKEGEEYLNAEMKNRVKAKEDQIEAAQEHSADLQSAINDLKHKLKHLPAECPNRRCDKEFGNLDLSRKGHPQRGANQGDWQIKCARCKCDLTRRM
jgi:hypothetical protein